MTPDRQPRPSRTIVAVAAILFVGIAVAVYRPLLRRPFDTMDMPGFLAILDSRQSIGARIAQLSGYFAAFGRWNPAVVLMLAMKWSVFGRAVWLWQLAAFAQMCAFAALLYAVLRRWGATMGAAICGVTLPLLSLAAAQGFARVTLPESLGAILLLWAVLLAMRLDLERPELRRVVGITVLAVVMVLLKEMFVVTVPLIWFSAAARPSESANPRVSTPLLRLVLVTGAASALALVPVAAVAFSSHAGSYAKRFSAGGLSLGSLLLRLAAMIVPFSPADSPMNVAVALADVFFIIIVFVGWRLYAATVPRRTWASMLAVSVGMPLIGALAYAPFPKYEFYYGIPFLVGPACLVALGLTGFQLEARRAMPLALAAWGVIAVYMWSNALRYDRDVDARVGAVVAATRELEGALPRDSAVIAICGLPAAEWEQIEATVPWYAASEHASVPALRRVSCEDAKALIASARVTTDAVILSASGFVQDRSLPAPMRAVTSTALRFDWRRFRFAGDTLEATFWSAPPE